MNRRVGWLYCAALFTCTVLFGQAPQIPTATRSVAAVKEHALTAEDLEAFLAGFMPLQIEQQGIPGAVIAVIKEGKLLYANGYGYADKEHKILVSPEQTLFRVGSVSKLFTWTAVMQQVELGKLDLDRDINDYLDFKIPPAFNKPITLRDLMTHRAGFEENYRHGFVSSASDFLPFDQYVREHIPGRIYPPGTIPAYSNYGAMLGGYLVELVSGQNFDDYIEEHLFKPLNMSNSTFRQPLPEPLKHAMSKGYLLGLRQPEPFELIQINAAGSLSTSAIDITHFMLMNLQHGRYENHEILKPETIALMHTRQEGWPKGVNAMCLGFFEQSENGYRVIGHGGDTHLFHSNLFLILDANVGLFVSYNSQGRQAGSNATHFFQKFMDRYFPEMAKEEGKKVSTDEGVSEIIGNYESSRRFETNALAMTAMMEQTKVYIDSEGDLLMTALKGLDQQPLHFREIAPMLFRDVDGKSKIAFIKDPQGNQLAYINVPVIAFQQIDHMLNKQTFNYILIGFSLAVILLTLLMWPIAAMIRNHYERPLLLDSGAKWLHFIVRLVCLIILLYVIGLIIFFAFLFNNGILTDYNDGGLYLLQVIGFIGCAGSLVVVYNSIHSWFDKQQWLWGKIWNTLLAAACLAFSWFIIHWHLLNFDLK